MEFPGWQRKVHWFVKNANKSFINHCHVMIVSYACFALSFLCPSQPFFLCHATSVA